VDTSALDEKKIMLNPIKEKVLSVFALRHHLEPKPRTPSSHTQEKSTCHIKMIDCSGTEQSRSGRFVDSDHLFAYVCDFCMCIVYFSATLKDAVTATRATAATSAAVSH
jgi:hypothetical protein